MTVVKRSKGFQPGNGDELEDFIKVKEVDEIIQCDPNISKAEIFAAFRFFATIIS